MCSLVCNSGRDGYTEHNRRTDSRCWRALAGGLGFRAAFAAQLCCSVFLLLTAAGLSIAAALVARPSALLNGLNHEVGSALFSTTLAVALAAGAVSFHRLSAWRLPLRLLSAAWTAFAVLGSIVPGAMLLDRERMMIAGLAGWTMLSSAVPFLLLWAVYALVCAIRSNLTTLQLFAAFRRGMDAGLVGVAVAWSIALLSGGHLTRLVALSGFYAFLIPWVIGFGLSLPRPTQPSARFAVVSIALAACMALYTIPWPFYARHDIECQWWFPAGRHAVYGFHDEPWHWRAHSALAWIFAPGALGELTIRNIAEPMTELRCAAPYQPDPWKSNYRL